ncbi:MAG TPA: hypothetical protein VF757_01090 [Sphingomicrobium sp.]
MRTSSIFKSRWMALVWAAGILWLAYDFAESAPQPSAPTNQQSDHEKQAAEVLNTL